MTLDENQEFENTLQEESIEGAIEAILMVTDAPISLVALATALEIPVNIPE
jgi:chromosome segregation and condensation protein ScpB